MITKPTFIALMEAVKSQEEKDLLIGKSIDVLGGDNNNPFSYTTELCSDVLRQLSNELNDKDQTISYYIYELDWGANTHGMSIYDKNHNNITPKNLSELYDYLIKYQ